MTADEAAADAVEEQRGEEHVREHGDGVGVVLHRGVRVAEDHRLSEADVVARKASPNGTVVSAVSETVAEFKAVMQEERAQMHAMMPAKSPKGVQPRTRLIPRVAGTTSRCGYCVIAAPK